MENNKKDQEKNFPGYPHYPAGEDITREDNNNGKLGLKEEIGDVPANNELNNTPGEDVEIVMGTEADVTAEDLKLLNAEGEMPGTGLDETDEDGDLLNEEAGADKIGDALDIPGAEVDDADEEIGEEDEENNYYSLGDTDTVDNNETAE